MSTQPTTDAPAVLVTVHPSLRGRVPGEPLAHGILTSSTTVLVPDPPETLASPWKRFLVRISRSPGDADDAEVVPVGGLGLAAVDADGITTAAAVLAMVWPSRFPVAVPSVTADRLTASLTRHHGDQWAAYAELGFRLVRPEQREKSDTWWLGTAGLTAGDVSDSARDYSLDTCCSGRLCCRGPAPAPSRARADAA
ncbi:hypothetical protein [Kitasatospora sp. NBC_00458]|uniref:hypothetical protein n=1 Tax=Kitasatospora sp. NBC_00458 TaxID=2903568 RepID=UPI002E186832